MIDSGIKLLHERVVLVPPYAALNLDFDCDPFERWESIHVKKVGMGLVMGTISMNADWIGRIELSNCSTFSKAIKVQVWGTTPWNTNG